MQISDRKKLILEIGKIGEQIVVELLLGAESADNWYDREKDGTYKGMKYEVKTIRLNNKTQGFWIDSSQWRKLDGVDVLFFVKVPESLEEGLQVFICMNHTRCWHTERTNSGAEMRCYPLTYCIPYGTIKDSRSVKAYENSKAASNHGRFANVY